MTEGGAHFETLQEDLNHDETRALECDCASLAEKAKHAEINLAVRGESAPRRDELGVSERVVWNAGVRGQASRVVRRTRTMSTRRWLSFCNLNAAEMRRIATGVKALSIWMNDTLRLRVSVSFARSEKSTTAPTHLRYAVLLRMSDPEKRTPMGTIDLR